VVIIGFFMPVSCNLNGFQLARYVSASDGFLGLALYAIFLFSCLGAVLLLLLVMKIQFSANWDWFAVIGAITSAVIVFVKLNGGRTAFGGNMFQSGAYVMLTGMIAALIFLLPVSNKSKKKAGLFHPAGFGQASDVKPDGKNGQKPGFSVNFREVVPKTEVLERITKNTNLPDTRSAVPKKNFCTQCGSKLKAGYNFCSNCGAKV
jgi:hypothetical protein